MWTPYNKNIVYNPNSWNGNNGWIRKMAVENPNKYWWNRGIEQANVSMMGMPNQQFPYDLNEYDENEELEYWRSMYPRKMQRVQEYVSGECDKIDYSGSVLYDEVPDWIYLRRIGDNIFEMIMEDEDFQEENDDRQRQMMDEDMMEQQVIGGHNCTGRNCRNPWLRDIIDVLLFNEIHRRRCNHRNCRRRFY